MRFEIIEMIILTKSIKHEAYCVAGININNGNWIRLCSNNKQKAGALLNKHLVCKNGKELEIMDKVAVRILAAVPSELQPENYLIDESYRIAFIEKSDMDEVMRIHPLEKPTYLFYNNYYKLTREETICLNKSLLIVKVNNLKIKQIPRNDGVKKPKAFFNYNYRDYTNISVTDPDFYSYEGEISSAILVMSLPDDEWSYEKDMYFKYIAKIFPDKSSQYKKISSCYYSF